MDNSKDDINVSAQKAAYLFAEHRMEQSEIADLLNLSQSHVSRLLKRAENNNYLIINKEFNWNGINLSLRREIESLSQPIELRNKLKNINSQNGIVVRNVSVFDCGALSSYSIEESKLSTIKFGNLASNRVIELVKESKTVGVSWGTTIGNVIVGGFDKVLFKDSSRRSIKFIPLCGDLMGEAANEFSSTRLANRLYRKISSLEDKQYFLSGVPAYIPSRYTVNEIKIIKKYINGCASYQKIFSDHAPIINEVDTFITSISTKDRPLGVGNSELANAAGITIKKMKSVLIGDIGGALIPKPNLTGEDKKLVKQLESMWTGIDLDRVKRIAEKAKGITPGNIIIARGKNKAQTILTCLSLGLINELIIDRELAEALDDLLPDGITD